MLSVDKLSREPIYEQLVGQFEMKIRLGDYPEGDPLPSVRALSAELDVNPNTLQKAYAELERRGLCSTAPGSGRFVAARARETIARRARERLPELGELAARLYRSGVGAAECRGAVDEALRKAKGEETAAAEVREYDGEEAHD